jgi:hypothetical protein
MPVSIESLGTGGRFTESYLMMNAVPGTRLISREMMA